MECERIERDADEPDCVEEEEGPEMDRRPPDSSNLISTAAAVWLPTRKSPPGSSSMESYRDANALPEDNVEERTPEERGLRDSDTEERPVSRSCGVERELEAESGVDPDLDKLPEAAYRRREDSLRGSPTPPLSLGPASERESEEEARLELDRSAARELPRVSPPGSPDSKLTEALFDALPLPALLAGTDLSDNVGAELCCGDSCLGRDPDAKEPVPEPRAEPGLLNPCSDLDTDPALGGD